MNQVNRSGFRVVPDTNVIIASKLSKSKTSPTKEFLAHWFRRDFVLLYTNDTFVEYARKLQEKKVAEEEAEELLASLFVLAESVEIKHFHLPYYPDDTDDTRFLLYAENGEATHLVSYDKHILTLKDKFIFKIVPLVQFLKELRATLLS